MRRLILTGRANAQAVRPARRPASPPAWRRHLRRWSAAGLALAMLVGLAAWGLHSGRLQAAGTATLMRLDRTVNAVSADAGLALDNVLVTGRRITEPSDLRAALGVARGMPILAVEPAAARAALERLPWVRRARVSRDLPDLLRVHLVERRPLALWQHRGALRVVAADGRPVPGAAPAKHSDLPLVVGTGAPAATPALLALLATRPALARRVRAAVRVSERRWNLRLDNDVAVQLPAEDPRRAWQFLAAQERRSGLLQRDIQVVDLRLPDRMVLRLAPGARPEPVASGEQT